ncbi:MAG TPA: thiolase family protein [Alphaproteobacteria bacterium]|nr:thiolase family protein [Alphaproteobacteria bacterium]
MTPCIIGAAALPVGRHQAPRDADLQTLERELLAGVVIDAMADAGVDKSMIDAMVFGLERDYPRQRYFGTFMANYLRLPAKATLAEVTGNGMTGGLAFDQAANEIMLGRAQVALALGINLETGIPTAEHLDNTMRHTGDVDFHTPFGFTPISWYAMDAMRYMHDTGATRADIASVAVKSRAFAAMNPLAQYRTPLTLEDVLAQRMIVEPLGLFEVPGRADGAVCIVLASEDVARSLDTPYLRMRGRGFFHEGAHQINEVPNDMTAYVAAEAAGKAAYAQAGIAPGDLDFAEIYAPCTITEVLASEAFGLVPRGHGAAAAAAGETGPGGRIPISSSGGCLSRGHPPWVTGLYSFVEAAEQLRGRAGARQISDARLGMIAAELGNYNAALVHIFEAVR